MYKLAYNWCNCLSITGVIKHVKIYIIVVQYLLGIIIPRYVWSYQYHYFNFTKVTDVSNLKHQSFKGKIRVSISWNV